mmetsp:Transcript_18517/g.46752  ORF Transcript_18517/g.46752 Transcript_18517/m.46752 type:complete len:284 (-) Transcript_18517:70-921(-)
MRSCRKTDVTALQAMQKNAAPYSYRSQPTESNTKTNPITLSPCSYQCHPWLPPIDHMKLHDEQSPDLPAPHRLRESLVHNTKEPAVLGAVRAADRVELRLEVARPHGRLVGVCYAQVVALALALAMKLELVFGDRAVLPLGGGPHQDGHVRQGVAILEVAAVHALGVVRSLEHVVPEVDERHGGRGHGRGVGKFGYEGAVLFGHLVPDLIGVLPRVVVGELVLKIRRNLGPRLLVAQHCLHRSPPGLLGVGARVLRHCREEHGIRQELGRRRQRLHHRVLRLR